MASQSSTVSQSKGTHGQWTRGFDRGIAAWDRGPAWWLAGSIEVFAQFTPQKTPNQSLGGFCCLLLSCFLTGKSYGETLVASLRVKQEPHSQKEEEPSLEDGK